MNSQKNTINAGSIHRPERGNRFSHASISNTALCFLLAAAVLTPGQGHAQLSRDIQNFDTNSIQTSVTPSDMDTLKINLNDFKKDHWTPQEVDNATMVIDLVQHVMNNHDFAYIQDRFGNHPYVQHNRSIPDGVAGLIEYIQAFCKQYPEFTYDVKHIYVDGDLVTLHSHATIKKKHRGNDKMGLNIMDTWRVENGKLVEHWDAVQPLNGSMRFYTWMTGGKIRNSNGTF